MPSKLTENDATRAIIAARKGLNELIGWELHFVGRRGSGQHDADLVADLQIAITQCSTHVEQLSAVADRFPMRAAAIQQLTGQLTDMLAQLRQIERSVKHPTYQGTRR